jgi:hypothetical protein
MSVRESESPELFARVQEQNLLRQYDLLANCIEIGLMKGVEAFDKYTLWALNAAAVSNIAQFGGRFREQPIYVGNHIPPHFDNVPNLVDQLLSVVHGVATAARTASGDVVERCRRRVVCGAAVLRGTKSEASPVFAEDGARLSARPASHQAATHLADKTSS